MKYPDTAARRIVRPFALLVILLFLFPSRELVAQITREETVTTNSTTSPTDLPSIQGGTSQSYVLYIATRKNQDVTNVTGGGLTWTERKEQCAGRAQTGIRVWTAQGSPGSAFQAQITWEGTEFLAAVITRYSGVDSFEDATGENTNGENGVCSGGADDTASQLTLSSTAGGAVHSIGLAPRNRNINSYSSGYTEVGNDVSGTSGDMTKLIVYEKEFGAPTTDTFQATLSSSQDWATAGLVLVPGPLPVELVVFEALVDGRDVVLSWQTASETNNAGFEVQRSSKNGDTLEVLDFVEGYGTTGVPRSYAIRVEDVEPGRHVFRLKQIDYDGTFEYSPEVEVSVEMPEAYFVSEVYPNPFNPEATLQFAVQRAQPVRVDLYDVLGRRVRALYEGVSQAGQMQTVRIEGYDLPSGLYVVRLVGERFMKAQAVTLLR